MTSFVLFFTFTLASGDIVTAMQDATHLEEYKPVRTLAQCERVAMEREARMNRGFVDHPGLVRSVIIDCKPAVRNRRKRK